MMSDSAACGSSILLPSSLNSCMARTWSFNCCYRPSATHCRSPAISWLTLNARHWRREAAEKRAAAVTADSRPSTTHAMCIGAIVECRPLNAARGATDNRTSAGTPPRPSTTAHDSANATMRRTRLLSSAQNQVWQYRSRQPAFDVQATRHSGSISTSCNKCVFALADPGIIGLWPNERAMPTLRLISVTGTRTAKAYQKNQGGGG